MDRLVKDDIKFISIGAMILGSGGGGNPYMGKLIVEKAIDEFGPITMQSVDELKETDFILAIGVMGTPTVFLEKMLGGQEFLSLIQIVYAQFGKKPTHLMSAEISGVNAMTPLMQAARLNLPVVDGDLIGRAFPEIDMNLTSLITEKSSPLFITDEKGNCVLIDGIHTKWNEKIVRHVSLAMGGTALIALPPLSLPKSREAMVAGSLSFAKSIGQTICNARKQHEDPVLAGCDQLNGKLLLRGNVIDIQRNIVDGFLKGSVTIHNDKETVEIFFQNEYLIVFKDKKVLTTTPNLICIVEEKTGEGISADEIRFGTQVAVYTALPDKRWLDVKGMELVSPRCFGYDIDYKSL